MVKDSSTRRKMKPRARKRSMIDEAWTPSSLSKRSTIRTERNAKFEREVLFLIRHKQWQQVLLLLDEKGHLLHCFTRIFKAIIKPDILYEPCSQSEVFHRIVALPSFRRADNNKVLTKAFLYACFAFCGASGDILAHTLVTRKVTQSRVDKMLGDEVVPSYQFDFIRAWITKTNFRLPVRSFTLIFSHHVIGYAALFANLVDTNSLQRLSGVTLTPAVFESISHRLSDRQFFLLGNNQQYVPRNTTQTHSTHIPNSLTLKHSERFLHTMLIEYLIAMAPLLLPVYIYGEIFQWLLPASQQVNWLTFAATTTRTLNTLRLRHC
jgi:hypothetical protein